MAGKNKTENGFRLYFDDSGNTARDLTASLVPGSVTMGYTLEQVDMTGVSDAMKNYLAGHADAPVTAKFFLDDTATTGSHTVLKGVLGSTKTLTLQWGSNGAAPTTGDPEWEGEYTYFGGSVSMEGGRAVLNAEWRPGTSTAAAWGTVA